MLFNKKMQDEFINDYATSTYESRSTIEPAPMSSPQMAARKSGVPPTRSVIDSWLTITGNLKSEGEVQVDGQINGDIHCAHLIVGKNATINGNIIAEDVVVRGKVTGSIRANRVTLQDTAVVASDIYHKSLAVEQGACFEGRSCRRDDPMKAETGIADLKAMAAEMKSAETQPDVSAAA